MQGNKLSKVVYEWESGVRVQELGFGGASI